MNRQVDQKKYLNGDQLIEHLFKIETETVLNAPIGRDTKLQNLFEKYQVLYPLPKALTSKNVSIAFMSNNVRKMKTYTNYGAKKMHENSINGQFCRRRIFSSDDMHYVCRKCKTYQ